MSYLGSNLKAIAIVVMVIVAMSFSAKVGYSADDRVFNVKDNSPDFLFTDNCSKSLGYNENEAISQGEIAEPNYNMEFISSYLWSVVNDVIIDGNYAYCAFDMGLAVLDITDPANIDSLVYLDLQSGCQGIEQSDNYLFVARGDSLVSIIDISNPLSPSLSTEYSLQKRCDGMLVVDSLLFCYSRYVTSSFEILDISNPLDPVSLSTYNTAATDLYVIDSLAYIAKQGGLLILNIVNPAMPDSIGFTSEYLSSGSAVSIQGSYAYVVDNSAGGIVVYNIADPTSPVFVDSMYTGNYTSDVITEDTIAIIATERPKILNITDPSNISTIATLTYMYSKYIAVSNQKCYMPSSVGLSVVDISDLTSPVIQSNYPEVRGLSYGIFIKDTLAYIPAFSGGFEIVDVSDILYPKLIGQYIPSAGWYREVIVENDLAYVVGWTGLSIFDVSDPTNPVRLSFLETDYDAINIEIAGSLAFIAHRQGSSPADIIIVDISDPNNPDSVGSIATPGYTYDVNVVDTIAYVADYDSGLYVFNIADYSNPLQLSNRVLTGHPTDLLVYSNRIFYVTSANTYIFDIADPLNPIDTIAGGQELFIHPTYGSNLFLANQGKVSVLEESGNTFVEVGYYYPPGTITDLYAVDSLIYMSGTAMSIVKYTGTLLDVDNTANGHSLPTQYTLDQNYPNPFNPATSIKYSVGTRAHVTIEIINILGQHVKTLVDETKNAGIYNVDWNGMDETGVAVSTGVYLYRFQAGECMETKKMVLLK